MKHLVASIGFLCVLYSAFLLYRHHQILEWPTVEATILKSEYVRNRKSAQMIVEYKYIVNGNSFTGNSISPSHWSGNFFTGDLTQRLAVGEKILVCYSRNAPEVAFIKGFINHFFILYTGLFGVAWFTVSQYVIGRLQTTKGIESRK